jgi:hypothetical protein
LPRIKVQDWARPFCGKNLHLSNGINELLAASVSASRLFEPEFKKSIELLAELPVADRISREKSTLVARNVSLAHHGGNFIASKYVKCCADTFEAVRRFG